MAVTDVGALGIGFEVELGKLRREMSAAGGVVKKSAQDFRFSLRGIGREVGALSKKFAAMAALSGVAVVAGLAAATKGAVEFADAIGKTADKAGVSVEALQELRFAGERVGVASRDMDDALTRLQRRLGLFTTSGGGPAKDAIKALGLETDITTGKLRGTEPVFNEVIRRLSGVEDQAKQSALASQLFGEDAGPRLVNLIKQGSVGIDQLRRRARELGVVLSDDLVRKAETANDQLFELGQILKVQFSRALLGAIPAIKAISDVVASPEFLNGLTQFANTIASVVAFLVKNKNEFIAAGIALTGVFVGASLFGLKGAAVGAAIGAIGGAIAYLKLQASDAELAQKRLAEGTTELGKNLGIVPFKLNAVGTEANKAAEKIKKFNETLREMDQDATLAGEPFTELDRGAIRLARSLNVSTEAIQAFIKARLEGAAVDAANGVEQLRKKLEQVENITKGRELFAETRTALEKFNKKIEENVKLLNAGAISVETYVRAGEMAARELEDATKDATDTTKELTEQQKNLKATAGETGSALSDGLRDAVLEGKGLLEVLNSLQKRLLDIGFNAFIDRPLTAYFNKIGDAAAGPPAATKGAASSSASGGGFIESIGGFFGSLFGGGFKKGGVVGGGRMPALFANAPSYALGGRVGPALRGGARPIIAHDGEGVLTVPQMRALRSLGMPQDGGRVEVVQNFYGDVEGYRRSRSSMATAASFELDRARRNR